MELKKETNKRINLLRYKKRYAFIDVETYNEIKDALPYDISIYILEGKKVIEKYCILFRDVFEDRDLMKKCYYKMKLPLYKYELKQPENADIIADYLDKIEMVLTLNDILEKHNISVIVGYNVNFDYTAINRLYANARDIIKNRKLNYKDYKLNYKTIPSQPKNRFKRVQRLDLWKVFIDIMKVNEQLRKQYYDFCLSNFYLTESGKCISTSEETVYRFFVNLSHEEYHIGFKDIEDEIQLKDALLQVNARASLWNKVNTYLNTTIDSSVFKNGIFSLKYIENYYKLNDLIGYSNFKSIFDTHK